ncbi:MAG TPA: GNAT family N-acetyltransferase [Phototrophicaceae bacterium]|nr:GNAT family N-acetyltransferase [Phototrophicaceae bacterium]
MAAVRSTAVPDMLITTYLQMTRREQFCPTYIDRADVTMRQITNPDTTFYKKLYTGVGADLRWRDRLLIPDAELKAALQQPGTSIYVLYVGENPAGYVELTRQQRETEIAYFGLFPAYHGMGLGKHLLSFGIEKAWAQGVERVWLHTCNLDSPHALDNYIKRGFQIYKVHRQPMPERYQ